MASTATATSVHNLDTQFLALIIDLRNRIIAPLRSSAKRLGVRMPNIPKPHAAAFRSLTQKQTVDTIRAGQGQPRKEHREEPNEAW
jgi:hypothetical protein